MGRWFDGMIAAIGVAAVVQVLACQLFGVAFLPSATCGTDVDPWASLPWIMALGVMLVTAGIITRRKRESRNLPFQVLAIVSLLLLVAVYPLPYGYYTFLRLIVCASAAFEAYAGLVSTKKSLWPWVAIAIALLFNPVIPVHLSKGTWAYFDVAAAVFFAALAYVRFRSPVG